MRDVEVIYPAARYGPDIVDGYLRSITNTLTLRDRELRMRAAVDGPEGGGASWVIEPRDDGLVAPPRPVARLYPAADEARIRAVLASAGKK